MTYAPDPSNLIEKLIKADVTFRASPRTNFLAILAFNLPSFAASGLLGFFYGPPAEGGRPGDFIKKKSRFAQGSIQKVTFDDVAGFPKPRRNSSKLFIFLKTPASTKNWAGRYPKEYCSKVRRARERLCWPRQLPAKPGCRFSISAVPISLRCLSE
jgi:ATP-dependent Zn protease